MAVQFALLAAIVIAGRLDVLTLDFPYRPVTGFALMAVAVLLGIVASTSLGRNLTPYPKPVVAGQMVEHGPYRVVRHPIYTAVVIGMLGVAIRAGTWPAVLLAIGLVPFFYAKSSFEERHLAEQYPEYGAYRERVPARLIPGVL